MTLRSRITQDPPTTEVTIDDGGSGGRRTHIVDVMVSWNPAVWSYVSHTPNPAGAVHVDAARGVVVWKKIHVPAGGKVFRVELTQIGSGASFIVATTTECQRDGAYNSARRKTKKKGKKKATRSVPRKKAKKKASARKSARKPASTRRSSRKK